jgi:hypothetical protein
LLAHDFDGAPPRTAAAIAFTVSTAVRSPRGSCPSSQA